MPLIPGVLKAKQELLGPVVHLVHHDQSRQRIEISKPCICPFSLRAWRKARRVSKDTGLVTAPL